MKLLLKVPFLDTQLLAKINDKLYETFGGNLSQMIIGGAALNRDVEQFLRRINFPFTVGYGMTECGPAHLLCPVGRDSNRLLWADSGPYGRKSKLFGFRKYRR